MNKRILFSGISIVATLALMAGATFAYFSSTQTVSANTISTGTLSFQGYVEDTSGNPTNFSATVAPGESATKCLFVENLGSVAGRFKVYGTNESGDAANVGNFLTISAELNPTSGDCSTLTVPNSLTNKYGPNDTTIPAMQNVAVRPTFLSPTTTPFKIASTDGVMTSNQYSLYRVTISMSPDATTQNSSYTDDVVILGEQAEGSLTNW